MKKGILLSALLATSVFASDSEMAILKEQMLLMQEQMQKMQLKLENYEAIKDKKFDEDQSNYKRTNKKSSIASAFEQSSFMPDMSLIIDTSYVSRNIKDSSIAHLELPGIAHGIYGTHVHDGATHTPINANNGFNLNYAELGFNSSVDSFFDLSATLHFSESSVEIEEAYFKTTSLPYSLSIKGGKFFSDFGRMNNQHHHSWDFSDQPLIYSGFLGMHGINEIGAQAQLVLPTSFYSMIGIEVLQGDNTSSFGTSIIAPTNDSETIAVDKPSQPNLYVGYLKASTDIGDTSILAGVSYATAKTRLDHQSDESPHAIAGNTNITNMEVTTKTMFDSYRYLQFQAEWMKRDMSAQKYVPNAAKDAWTSITDLKKEQEGYYTQLTYAFNKEYKAGARYENIYKNVIDGVTSKEDLTAYSFKLDYKPSEFSLFRVQYNANDALFNEAGERMHMDEIIFQMNFAIGAHPAHNF